MIEPLPLASSDRSPEVHGSLLARYLSSAPRVAVPMSQHRPFTEYLPVFHHWT